MRLLLSELDHGPRGLPRQHLNNASVLHDDPS